MSRLLLLACLLLTAPAWAQEDTPVLSGTLQTILDRGTILIGVRDSAVPFAFRNPGGQPVGFSVDLCHGIAEDVADMLHRDLLDPEAPAWRKGVRIVYVPIAAADRIPDLIGGKIDLECGSTTDDAEREKTVAFSPVFFLAGTKLLVAKDSKIGSYRGLAGKTVAVSAGTTNAEVVKRLAARVVPPIAVAEEPDLSVAYDKVASGAAAAMASDDILLSGLIATRPDGKRFQVVGDYLSYEPYAIAHRRDDKLFADLVKASFGRMAAEGRLHALYDRWLTDRLPNGETMNLPMSPHVAEMYRVLGEPD